MPPDLHTGHAPDPVALLPDRALATLPGIAGVVLRLDADRTPAPADVDRWRAAAPAGRVA